ncbi:OmpH family outer membrane protein [Candidatus Pelagibacter sp.]|uniref:OmpH family outer membrane protein n=1 Tax=Candidatus Pelagibacter sp. TaxID=2024849 RepID=UPI003F86E17D
MKKNLLIYIIFFFSFSFANANEKIAFIDIDFLLTQSKAGKSVLSDLDKLNKKNISDLKSQEQKLIKEREELDKLKNISSQEDINIKIQAFKKKIEQFNKQKVDLSSKFNNKRDEETLALLQKINPIISDYMEKNQITLIFDKKNIYIAKSELDITKPILEIVNSKVK